MREEVERRKREDYKAGRVFTLRADFALHRDFTFSDYDLLIRDVYSSAFNQRHTLKEARFLAQRIEERHPNFRDIIDEDSL